MLFSLINRKYFNVLFQSEALALLKSPQAVSPSPASSPHTGSNAESPIRRAPSRDPHHFDDVKRSGKIQFIFLLIKLYLNYHPC